MAASQPGIFQTDDNQTIKKFDDLIFGIRNLTVSSNITEVSPLIAKFDEIRISLGRPELSMIVKEVQEKISILTKAKNFQPATRLKDKICIVAARAI